MHQLDDTDDSGNEYGGESNTPNRPKMNDSSYWDNVYKNRRQTVSFIGGKCFDDLVFPAFNFDRFIRGLCSSG